MCHALKQLRIDKEAQVTVLSDGDAGLRTVQWELAPGSAHILDWFVSVCALSTFWMPAKR
jgi:hypothetical protein